MTVQELGDLPQAHRSSCTATVVRYPTESPRPPPVEGLARPQYTLGQGWRWRGGVPVPLGHARGGGGADGAAPGLHVAARRVHARVAGARRPPPLRMWPPTSAAARRRASCLLSYCHCQRLLSYQGGGYTRNFASGTRALLRLAPNATKAGQGCVIWANGKVKGGAACVASPSL